MYALILVLYNLAFFWKFYRNPYLNSTSEMSTTFFPHWIWMGRELRKGRFPFKDNLYYKYPGCIPFLSTFYLPSLLMAWACAGMGLDKAFRIYTRFILSHFILGSFLAYYWFSSWCGPEIALFGAITLMYSGYSIKIQQPTIIYTMAWIPGIFLGGWVSLLSMAMVFYAGYYPILIYLMPLLLILHTKMVIFGALLALPQLIPFLWYYFKSVRFNSSLTVNVKQIDGKVPIQKLIELVLPVRERFHTNGVMFMEMQMYMGVALFFVWFSTSKFWLVAGFGLLTALGWVMRWDRIPARALYIITLGFTVLATDGLQRLGINPMAILFLQAFLLLFNRDIYPCFPFTQWWEKPSELYQRYIYPGTHYLSEIGGVHYSGAFSLR